MWVIIVQGVMIKVGIDVFNASQLLKLKFAPNKVKIILLKTKNKKTPILT
jgi:hypothetical protein